MHRAGNGVLSFNGVHCSTTATASAFSRSLPRAFDSLKLRDAMGQPINDGSQPQRSRRGHCDHRANPRARPSGPHKSQSRVQKLMQSCSSWQHVMKMILLRNSDTSDRYSHLTMMVRGSWCAAHTSILCWHASAPPKQAKRRRFLQGVNLTATIMRSRKMHSRQVQVHLVFEEA